MRLAKTPRCKFGFRKVSMTIVGVWCAPFVSSCTLSLTALDANIRSALVSVMVETEKFPAPPLPLFCQSKEIRLTKPNLPKMWQLNRFKAIYVRKQTATIYYVVSYLQITQWAWGWIALSLSGAAAAPSVRVLRSYYRLGRGHVL